MANLLAWYPLHKDAKDWSGNGNHPTNSTQLSDVGGVLSNKALAGILTIPKSKTLDKVLSGTEATLAFWARESYASGVGDWGDLINYTPHGGAATVRFERADISVNTNAPDYWSNWFNGAKAGNGSVRHNSSATKAGSINSWFHVVVRRKGSTIEVWLNGQLDGTYGVQGEICPIKAGATLNLCAHTSAKSHLQDVRLYDGAVSIKTIKELAQGKVLHYTYERPSYKDRVTTITDWGNVYAPYATKLESTHNSVKVQMVGTGTIAIQPRGFSSNGKKVRVSGYLRKNGQPVTVNDLSTYGTTIKALNDPKTGWFCVEEHAMKSVWLIHTTFTSKAVGDIFEFTDLVVENISAGGAVESEVLDVSGFENHGVTYTRSPAHNLNAGGMGIGSMHFESPDRLRLPPLDFYADKLTLITWVKLHAFPNNDVPLMAFGRFRQVIRGKKLAGYWSDSSPAGFHLGNRTIPLKEWVMVANVWDGQTLKLYVNGELDKTINTTTNRVAKNSSLIIGNIDSNHNLNGELAESVIYVSALNGEDIKEAYQSKASLNKDGEFRARVLNEIDSRVIVSNEIKGVCDHQQYGQILTTSNIEQKDFTDWIEADNTLGEIFLTAEVYITNTNHTPTKFEFTRKNNDMGFYFYFDDKKDWKKGWNKVTLTRHMYDISPIPDWSNMNRWEQYASGINNSALTGNDYILFRNVRINKMRSGGSIINQMGVTKQSVLNVGQVVESNFKPTLIDYSTWRVGDTSASGFGRNGGADENKIVVDKNPQDDLDVMWQTPSNNTGSDADGGFVTSHFNIDKTKAYRYCIWIKRNVTGNGSMYWGCYGNDSANKTALESLGGSANGNPYFYSGGAPSGHNNEWMLFVAYVYPAGTTTETFTDDGIYLADGTKIKSGLTPYRWGASAVKARARSYLYYSTDVNTVQSFYKPRVEAMDGSEVPLEDILNGCDHVPLIYAYSNGVDYDGECGAKKHGAFVSQSFIEV